MSKHVEDVAEHFVRQGQQADAVFRSGVHIVHAAVGHDDVVKCKKIPPAVSLARTVGSDLELLQARTRAAGMISADVDAVPVPGPWQESSDPMIAFKNESGDNLGFLNLL